MVHPLVRRDIAVESFTIQCTSCESRIRVRNPNMIGQIANCPKCGSMILIAAPQQITVESGNATDSVAVTREALPPPDESLLNSQGVFETGFRIEGLPPVNPPANSPAHSQVNPRNADLAHSLPEDDEYRLAADFSAANESEAEPSSDSLPLGAWLPGPTTTDPAPPPRGSDIDSSIQSVRAKRQESAARSRHVMLVATIGLCSMLIAIGVLVAFLRWVSQPDKLAQNKPVVNKPAGDDKPGEANAAAAAAAAAVAVDQLPQAGNDLNNAAGNATGADGQSPVAPQTLATPGDAGNGLPVDPSSPNVPAAPVDPLANNPTAPASTTPQPTTPSAPSTMGNAAAPKSPLGGSIAPSLDAVLGPSTTDAPKGNAPLELPPGLQGFSQMFDQEFEPVLPDASVPLDKPLELPEDADAKPKNSGDAPNATPAADPVPAIVDKMLGTPILGIAIDKRPLSEALTTLALVSDIPIVPDLDALLVVGASKSTLVEVKAKSATTFDAVLKSITATTKISMTNWENRVVYARASDQDLEKLMPAVLPISDLVDDDAQRDQLVQGLKEVLPELGDALQLGEGGLQLALTKENRLTWFQLARLLETWRVARGITNEATSAVVPKSSLLPAWPAAAMEQVAKSPVKQIVPAEPIARSWQRLTAEARVACWIDWYGLQMNETNPRQKATVFTSGRSLEEVLKHYANKYQVVFAIEDSRALWVTSTEMHRLQPRLYVLPLAQKTLEEWTAELEPLAPLNPANGASMLKLIPTPDGQYLLARCCRPILVAPE